MIIARVQHTPQGAMPMALPPWEEKLFFLVSFYLYHCRRQRCSCVGSFPAWKFSNWEVSSVAHIFFSFPSSTLLRDDLQEEEGLGPNARWRCPGELNSLLTVPHPSLEWAHPSSTWHFPTVHVFRVATRAPCVLSENAQALLVGHVFTKFSLVFATFSYSFRSALSFLLGE